MTTTIRNGAGRLAALVVGISNYGSSAVHLPGCHEDARSWRDLMITTYAAAEADTRVLLDRRADRAGVVEGLRWLLGRHADCSRLVFCFAGHGTLVERTPPQPGGVLSFEEAIVCCAASPAEVASAYLFDHDLSTLVAQSGADLAAVSLTLVIDACHAGGFVPARAAARASAARARFHPPARVSAPALARQRPRRFGVMAERSRVSPRGGEPVLVAAARSNESAFDAKMDDGRHHGVFSYYATALLGRERGLSYRALASQLARQIGDRFDQEPEVEGAASRLDRSFTD